MNIRDVSGKIPNVCGTRRVPVLLDGVVDCVIPFGVADVTRPIFSLGKLTKQDYIVHLERETSLLNLYRARRQKSLAHHKA